MVMSKGAVLDLLHENFPSARRSYAQAEQMHIWGGGKQSTIDAGKLFVPNRGQSATEEYTDLGDRSYTPWMQLVITALVQTMFVEGINIPGLESDEVLKTYEVWKKNGWDAKQISLYREQFTCGEAFALVLPGEDRLTGEAMPVMKPRSARNMAAFWTDDDDEYPMFAIDAEHFWNGTERGWTVQLIDEDCVHYASCKGDGEQRKDWFYISYELHETGVTPVSRYHNIIDLQGNVTSEVEPLIPIAKRIDQTMFDRLIVQRFGAWKVRYITGLVKPTGISDEEHAAGLLKMKVGDFLALEGENAKVGTLDETQLDGFIKARDADIRDMSAVSQTPPHHMLGLASNMQPESLAAVNANLQAKKTERQVGTGIAHIRTLRLTATQMGNAREARAWDMQVRWKDMETRSFAQAADALGKVATQLNVPVEMLWRRIPDWTEYDTQEAKRLVENGAIDALLAGLEAQGIGPANQGTPPAPVKV